LPPSFTENGATLHCLAAGGPACGGSGGGGAGGGAGGGGAQPCNTAQNNTAHAAPAALFGAIE